ncbi:MAG: hypothetical protein ACYCZY_04745 [Lacisediminihabitans sp.]
MTMWWSVEKAKGRIGAMMTMYALELIGHERVSYLDGGWGAYQASESPPQG